MCIRDRYGDMERDIKYFGMSLTSNVNEKAPIEYRVRKMMIVFRLTHTNHCRIGSYIDITGG